MAGVPKELELDDSLRALNLIPTPRCATPSRVVWFPPPGPDSGTPLVKFKGKLLVPVARVDGIGYTTYWREHPAVVIKFATGPFRTEEHALLSAVFDFYFARNLNTKLFVRVIYSDQLSTFHSFPTVGFVRAMSKFITHLWASVDVVVDNDPLIYQMIRFTSYLGLKQVPCEVFRSEEEYDRCMSTKPFTDCPPEMFDEREPLALSVFAAVEQLAYAPSAEDLSKLPRRPASSTRRSRFAEGVIPTIDFDELRSDCNKMLSDECLESLPKQGKRHHRVSREVLQTIDEEMADDLTS